MTNAATTTNATRNNEMDAYRKFEAVNGSELVEDRSNPEMRDMDGWPTKPIHFVNAYNPYGHSFRHSYRFDTEEEAVALAERVNAYIALNPGWTPDSGTSRQHWTNAPLVYGSTAYQNEGGEEDLIAFEMRCEEDSEWDRHFGFH